MRDIKCDCCGWDDAGYVHEPMCAVVVSQRGIGGTTGDGMPLTLDNVRELGVKLGLIKDSNPNQPNKH